MIIHKSILKDIFRLWIAILLILVSIAISHRLVRLISKAATGELSSDILMQLLGFQVPELIAFMIPLSLFLSILLTFSRYSVDQELTAWFALGTSWRRLLFICLSSSMLFMLLTASFTLLLNPTLAHKKNLLLAEEDPVFLLQAIDKGRFYSFQGDKLVFYVEEVSEDKKQLQQIFIAEQPASSPNAQENWTVITALKGQVGSHSDSGNTYIELKEGRRYEGTPGLRDYLTISFEKFGKLVEKKTPQSGNYAYRSMPTTMLLDADCLSCAAELQWRLALPISIPILTILAVPLGVIPPRKGRFHRLLPALIFFIIYYNLLTMCKRWISNGTLSASFGMWWVHGLMLLIGIGIVLHVSGHTHQLFRLKEKKP